MAVRHDAPLLAMGLPRIRMMMMTMRLWIAPLLLAGGVALVAPAEARRQCSTEMSGVQGELVVITEDGRYCEATSEDRNSYEQRFVAPPPMSAPMDQAGMSQIAMNQIAARRAGNVVTRPTAHGTTNVVNSGCVNPTGDTKSCLNTGFNFSKAATHVRPVMVGMF